MSLIFKFIFLGIILFKIVNCVIDKVGKSLELAEYFIYLFQHIRLGEEVIGDIIRTDIFFTLQIINVFKIFWKALRSSFQEVFPYHRKVFLKLRIFYDRNKFLNIVIN